MNALQRKKEKAKHERSQKEANKKGISETKRKNGYIDDERETYRKGWGDKRKEGRKD